MDKVHVGLIGCGGMGKSLMKGMNGVKSASLVAVSDVSEKAVKAYAEEKGVAWHTDHRELLARDDVDGVVIAVPNKFHAPVTIDAAQAGKHVFCEKPMAMNAAECREMISTCDAAGVKLQIGQVLRYHGDFKYSLQIVRDGELGDLFYGYIARYGTPGGLPGAWRSDPDIVGNWLLEVSVHEIDYARLLFGKPVAVTAWMYDQLSEGTVKPDMCNMVVEFANGGVCHLVMGQFSALGKVEAELSGTKGAVRFHWNKDFVVRKMGEEQECSVDRDTIAGNLELPTQREVREWIECIIHDTPPTIPGSEGMANIQIVDAAFVSAREKRRVSIEGSGATGGC
ncbi:MAG: hypothetical protein AUJ92_12425 [Armatimonadetes bacterium CG2_30_59_28]|nr:MAG: hypothetical protein AUJ92_12425 [Armatimonadetes bacterium CG2_30_59_28]PIU62800.1 MAG: hypothetical protein COS85_17515 [Armatimonadetes bacterium CG07_land_8_20_14_0_80_59_28]